MFDKIKEMLNVKNTTEKKTDPERLDNQLREIEELKPKEERRSDVRYQIRNLDEEIVSYEEWQEEIKKSTFSSLLLHLIEKSGKSNKEFYEAAHLDRKLFSAIKSNEFYQPSKETAVACCLGLRLPMAKAKRLLGRAGYSLSLSIAWDRAVYYCIKNGIYDIFDVNEILYAMGERCLRDL